METFNEPKKFVKNERYVQDRKKSLATLDLGAIDEPIMDIVAGFAKLSYCFTLQCCYGHFVYAPKQNPYNMDPIPCGYDGRIRYRIAYIALCIEDCRRGPALRDSLARITEIAPDYVQFGSPDWFWKHWVNSYALQVEPNAHKFKDEVILEPAEALQTQRVRNLFFKELRKVLTIELSKHVYVS